MEGRKREEKRSKVKNSEVTCQPCVHDCEGDKTSVFFLKLLATDSHSASHTQNQTNTHVSPSYCPQKMILYLGGFGHSLCSIKTFKQNTIE